MIYLGIGDLPIYNFDKILKSNNMAYMVIGWNEREEIEIPKEAQSKWDEVYNEYCKRTANNEALTFYSLSCEIGYLEMRFLMLYHLISGLNESNKKEFGREINAWKVPFNINGNIEEQIPNLKTQLRIAEQNINIKKNKLKSLKNDEVEEQTSILKQIIIINEQLGIKIDIRKDSVEYLLTATERLKEKLEQQKASSNG